LIDSRLSRVVAFGPSNVIVSTTMSIIRLLSATRWACSFELSAPKRGSVQIERTFQSQDFQFHRLQTKNGWQGHAAKTATSGFSAKGGPTAPEFIQSN
jgi:hypothetical protein